MTKAMHVTVDLDPKMWWQLSIIAERHNMTVPGLLEELATRLVSNPKHARARRPLVQTPGKARPTYSKAELERQVSSLYGRSKSDAHIAAQIGCSVETVRQTRVGLKLPPRGQWRGPEFVQSTKSETSAA
jgi:DNA-binding CsgD family transcriptional regulator